jgi:hypothetical protein
MSGKDFVFKVGYGCGYVDSVSITGNEDKGTVTLHRTTTDTFVDALSCDEIVQGKGCEELITALVARVGLDEVVHVLATNYKIPEILGYVQDADKGSEVQNWAIDTFSSEE